MKKGVAILPKIAYTVLRNENRIRKGSSLNASSTYAAGRSGGAYPDSVGITRLFMRGVYKEVCTIYA